jgi:hypothetical protein
MILETIKRLTSIDLNVVMTCASAPASIDLFGRFRVWEAIFCVALCRVDAEGDRLCRSSSGMEFPHLTGGTKVSCGQ